MLRLMAPGIVMRIGPNREACDLKRAVIMLSRALSERTCVPCWPPEMRASLAKLKRVVSSASISLACFSLCRLLCVLSLPELLSLPVPQHLRHPTQFCGVFEAPQWRRIDRKLVCNRCGMYFHRHGRFPDGYYFVSAGTGLHAGVWKMAYLCRACRIKGAI